VDQVSKDEYQEWKNNRVTKRYIQGLFDTREELKEGIVEESQSTDQARFVAIGRCQALKDAIDFAIFNFDYEGKYNDVEISSPSDNS